jgi:hypothetical protein
LHALPPPGLPSGSAADHRGTNRWHLPRRPLPDSSVAAVASNAAPLPIDFDGDETDGNLISTDVAQNLRGLGRNVTGVDFDGLITDRTIDIGAYQAQTVGAFKPALSN